MESLNNILRIQPKTRIEFNPKSRYSESIKAKRIHYEKWEPLDNIQVESTLSELERRTRSNDHFRKNQYMPEKWSNGGRNARERQENFDECIYEQQLTQRLGPGIYTQQPQLEWISLQEALTVFRVKEKTVRLWIEEEKLKVLQRIKDQLILIYIDESFFKLFFPNSSKTSKEKIRFLRRKLKSVNPELRPQKYEKWFLPSVTTEIVWPEHFSDKFLRLQLANKEYDSKIFMQNRSIANVEKENFPAPYHNLDVNYFNTLLKRSTVMYLGKPTLRYFTTQEAAWYLRINEQSLINAVKSEELTPMKTDLGEHYIFEKKQLLVFAGPSSNPITADESTQKTLAWLAAEFQADFSGTIPPDAESRVFLSEAALARERKKLKKSFIRLSEVSFPLRVQNLFFFNWLLNPKLKYFQVPKAMKDIDIMD